MADALDFQTGRGCRRAGRQDCFGGVLELACALGLNSLSVGRSVSYLLTTFMDLFIIIIIISLIQR